MDILQRYRELRSMGQGESRAKVGAAIEYARASDFTVNQALGLLEKEIEQSKQRRLSGDIL